MIEAHEILIRQRAYEIWEAEGRPEGRQHEHWEQAMRELEMQVVASPIAADAPAEKPAKRKAATKVTPIDTAPAKTRKTRQPSA
jgi:hypothetical protein